MSRSQRRGAECVAIELAQELDALGHKNFLVSLVRRHDGNEDPSLPALSRGSALNWRTRPAIAWRLNQYISQRRADVVLAHGGTAAQLAVVSNARRRHAVMWQQIGPFPDKILEQPRRALWWLATRNIDGAITLSDEAAERVRKLGYRGPIWVVPNFRSPKRFLDVDRAASGANLRKELGIAPSTALIGFLGYLGEPKHPERTLNVISDVRSRGINAHLVIVGDGPERSAMERRINEMELNEHVTLLGHRDDVERLLGGVDVALLTSDYEGIPGVAIEAAMAGCPFVSFPVGQVDQVVDDRETGLILERSDMTLMAERVANLICDEPARVRMGVEARRRSQRFAAPERVKAYVDAIGQCHDATVARLR